jgi:hypothetical protein
MKQNLSGEEKANRMVILKSCSIPNRVRRIKNLSSPWSVDGPMVTIHIIPLDD